MVNVMLERCLPLVLPERGGTMARPPQPLILEAGEIRRYGITYNIAFVVAQILLHGKPGTTIIHYTIGQKLSQHFLNRILELTRTHTFTLESTYDIHFHRGTRLMIRVMNQRIPLSSQHNKHVDLIFLDDMINCNTSFVHRTLEPLMNRTGAQTIGVMTKYFPIHSIQHTFTVVNIDPTPLPCKRYQHEIRTFHTM
jgi:hypothetical protein